MNRKEASALVIGGAGAVMDLDTPALLIDLPVFRRNLARMAAFAVGAGVALRPHVKTHKSSIIAKAQIDAGAVGVSCATIDEAEIMVGAGIGGVLITAPLVGQGKIDRLMALARSGGPGSVMVVVDHPDDIAALNRAATGLGFGLRVLVDLDIGQHRTGCPDAATALIAAGAVAASPHLIFAGIQAYGGHLQHLSPRTKRREAAMASSAQVRVVRDALNAAGFIPSIVTGAGTGTYDLDGTGALFTELQVGSYLFMDVEYGTALSDGEMIPPFEPALFVLARVIGTHQPTYQILDAGLKSFATEGGPPRVMDLPDAAYGFFGDEHGKLFIRDPLALGTSVRLQPPHCDPTVHLYDWYHAVEDGVVVARWPIDARGRR